MMLKRLPSTVTRSLSGTVAQSLSSIAISARDLMCRKAMEVFVARSYPYLLDFHPVPKPLLFLARKQTSGLRPYPLWYTRRRRNRQILVTCL